MSKPGYSDVMQGNVASAFARRGAVATVLPAQDAGSKPSDGRKALPGASMIEINRVLPDPDQPRTDWDSPEAIAELEDLAESLKARGQLQPIRVRWNPTLDGGKFQVILGERRWRAARKAGMATIACVVVEDNATPEDRIEDQLVENALRRSIRPIEAAKTYQRLMVAKGYTHRDLAEKLNIPHPAITQAMQLLTLPEPIQQAVDAGEIKPATAYEIAKETDPAEQAAMATDAAAGRLSRDQVRDRVSRGQRSPGKGRGASKAKSRPSKLPAERKHKASNGLTILTKGRKGFDLQSWADALGDALASVRAMLEAEQGSHVDSAQVEGTEAA